MARANEDGLSGSLSAELPSVAGMSTSDKSDRWARTNIPVPEPRALAEPAWTWWGPPKQLLPTPIDWQTVCSGCSVCMCLVHLERALWAGVHVLVPFWGLHAQHLSPHNGTCFRGWKLQWNKRCARPEGWDGQVRGKQRFLQTASALRCRHSCFRLGSSERMRECVSVGQLGQSYPKLVSDVFLQVGLWNLRCPPCTTFKPWARAFCAWTAAQSRQAQ